jgi:hypothetical protein
MVDAGYFKWRFHVSPPGIALLSLSCLRKISSFDRNEAMLDRQ